MRGLLLRDTPISVVTASYSSFTYDSVPSRGSTQTTTSSTLNRFLEFPFKKYYSGIRLTFNLVTSNPKSPSYLVFKEQKNEINKKIKL